MEWQADFPSFWHSGLPQSCISPIVVTQPGMECYPGIASGTGFFVRRDRQVYFLTALHCLEYTDPPIPFDRTAHLLSIPFRTDGTTNKDSDYVQFDLVTRLAEDLARSSFVDAVALRVREGKRSHHQQLLSRAAKLPPTGFWLDQFVEQERVKEAMDANDPLTFVVMGYPNNGTSTEVTYADSPGQLPEIQLQSALFSGDLRLSKIDHCYKLENLSWPGDLAGFSGSPVFVQLANRHGKQSALAGMLICGCEGSTHFVAISTLVRAVEESR